MNTKVTEFLQRKGVIPAAVGFLSFAAGAGLGYILGKRNGDHFDVVFDSPEQLSLLKTTNEIRMELIPDYTYDDYRDNHLHNPMDAENPDPVQPEYDPILEALLDEEERIVMEASSKANHSSVIREEVEPELLIKASQDDEDEAPVIVHKVKFPHHGDIWDQEEEMTTRGPRVPYTIHQEEFFADEMGFHQQTVTYYAGDDIMADQEDVPVYNWYGQMGDLRFGHGSTDVDTVYIRNEMLKSEWEVIREQGSFSVEVLGHQLEEEAEEEIKHSNRSVPKFRRE